MELHAPWIISSRLLPALKVADCTISLESFGQTRDGRIKWRAFFDFDDGRELTDDSLRSGCGGGDHVDAMASLLSFLSACADARRYSRQTGRVVDNCDLFAADIAAWAEANDDEIGMASLETKESAAD